MEEIFRISGAIIVSFGGGAAIILAFSKWFGQVLANKLLEKEKGKYASDLEEFKHKLNKEVAKLNANIDKTNHISKMQYDKEFEIYLEIWEKLSDCVIATKNLYPIIETSPQSEKELKEYKIKKWEDFVSGFNSYSNAIIKYAPFYEEKLNEGFVKLRERCHDQSTWFSTYDLSGEKIPKDERRTVYRENSKTIDELHDLLQKQVRSHLQSLQTYKN